MVAGETSRLAREADLKTLDGVRAQLKDAEERQVKNALALLFYANPKLSQASTISDPCYGRGRTF